MVALVSRKGRQFQRYTKSGGRLVVGCIPYKFTPTSTEALEKDFDKSMQVLVISSPKGNGLLFPKGGWESDETIKEAASREALEEAGVQGHVEQKLGRWTYKSRTYEAYYEGIMFPLNVTEELGHWPEISPAAEVGHRRRSPRGMPASVDEGGLGQIGHQASTHAALGSLIPVHTNRALI